MRELDDAALELQLRRVLDERLGTLPLELTAEALERRRATRDQVRRRRRVMLGLGLAAALVLPAGWLAAGGLVPRPHDPVVVADTPTPSPPSSVFPAPSPVEAGVTPPIVEELGRWTTGQLSAFGSALLADGRVLLLGGADTTIGQQTVATAWLFDPATRRIEPTGAMTDARADPLAVTLSDGRVLVFGGWAEDPSTGEQSALSTAELYDPGTGTFVRTAGLPDVRRDCPCGALNTLPWAIQHATVLPDGRVFVAGGDLSSADGRTGSTVADVFDPVTERWSRLAVGCDAARGTQALLPDGRLLLTCLDGGRDSPILRARLFDPERGAFTDAATPPAANSVATALADGRILLTGREPVLYDASADAYERLPSGPHPGAAQGGIDVGQGRVLFLGDPNGAATLTFDTRSGTFAVGPASLATADAVVLLGDGRILTVGHQLEARLLSPGQAP